MIGARHRRRPSRQVEAVEDIARHPTDPGPDYPLSHVAPVEPRALTPRADLLDEWERAALDRAAFYATGVRLR